MPVLKTILIVAVMAELASGAFLLIYFRGLAQSEIRLLGLIFYMVLVVVVFGVYIWKRNSASLLYFATLSTQGVIGMVANAAFGFQAAWIANSKTYNAIVYYLSGHHSTYGLFTILILAGYFMLLLASAVAAISSYLLSKQKVVW